MPRPRFKKDPERRFEFQLARDLGMTHAELMLRLSMREFAEWLAFYRLEVRDVKQATGGGG